MGQFYTYLWLRENGTPYYAGKGSDDRAYRWHARVHMPPVKERILVQEHASEEEAFVAEKFLIDFYGRKDLGTGCLANMTDGGEGFSGARHTEDSKKRIGKASLGNKYSLGVKISEETRRKISEASKGRPCSEETKLKISKANLGNTLSPEHKAKLRETHLGVKRGPMPADVKSKISKKLMGHTFYKESIEKMKQTRTGKPWSATRRQRYELRQISKQHEGLPHSC